MKSSTTSEPDCQPHAHGDLPVICLHDVCVAYQETVALHDVNIAIQRGDFLGILGPNGSGKTTMLKTMLGVVKPFRGLVHLVGKDRRTINRRDFLARVGYIPQKMVIDPHFPALVKDVVAMGLYGKTGFFGRMSKQDKESVREALVKVGVDGLEDRPIGHLSGGQQQKVIVARALANNPEILLLDEPTANLDFKAARSVVDLIDKLHKETKMTVVLVSHSLPFLKQYANRVVVVQKQILWDGPPDSPELDEIVTRVFLS